MIGVLIVEDDPMARQCFELFISESEDYSLVASIENAKYALKYCKEEKVNLIIMDILTQEQESGLKAAKQIKSDYPDIKIIIVTSLPEYSYLEYARKIGIDSFWYKEVLKEPFFKLMDRTMAGERIFPENIPTFYVGNAKNTDFTKREIEVLREVIRGATNPEIAQKLNLSVRTVKAHIQNMQEKTGYKNRTQLAINARVHGFCEL